MKIYRASSALIIGTLIVASAVVAARAPMIAAQPAAPPQVTGACTGAITTTLSSSSIRMCETATVTTTITPECRSCPGGINVVFASYLNHTSQSGGWTNQVMTLALDKVGALGRDDLKVGVVLYSANSGPRVALPLTTDLSAAKGPLSRPARTNLWDGHSPFQQVAKEALGLLTDDRRGATKGLEPCEIIVFMAYHTGATEETGNGSWERLRDAARMIKGEGVTLTA